jgi:3-isopropylmalate/(R)-2-methylmalate dehydratase small subunit
MKPFTTLEAVAAPLDEPNIDTDQLAPARFLRRPRAEGYGRFLFHDLRFDAEGAELPAFVLNRPAFRAARILVADRNFGGGSSREQAVWALLDHGIRCVVAESFGDIFYANSINQGLLLIRLPMEALLPLRGLLHASPGTQLTVDLAAQRISAPDGTSLAFEIEPSRKQRLLLGLDAIGMTLRQADEIAAFAVTYRARRPWLFRLAERSNEERRG